MTLKDEELTLIIAGATINATMINAISKLVNTILDIGRAVGSGIAYATGKTNSCH